MLSSPLRNNAQPKIRIIFSLKHGMEFELTSVLHFFISDFMLNRHD